MRIRTRSFVIMATQGLQQAAGLILPIVLVRLITQDLLGSYRQVTLAYNLLAGILSYQLGNSLYYFLPRTEPEERRKLLAQTFLGTSVRAMLIGIVLLLGAGPIAVAFNNPDLVAPLRMMGLYALGDSLADLIPAFMISLDRAVRAGVYSLAGSLGRIAAILSAFALGWSLTAVVALVILVQTAIMLVGCVDMIRLSPGGFWRLDRDLMREQWRYSWPLWPTTVLGTVSVYFDKLVISKFFTPAVYAVYSCGAMDVPLIALVTTSMGNAIMPNLVTMVGGGKQLEAYGVWQEAARKCSLVIFPCFAFFMVVARDFIMLLYGPDYARAAWPFCVYLCALPLRVAVYAAMFRAMGATRTIAVGAVLTLGTNIILSVGITWLSIIYLGEKSILAFIGPSIGAAGAVAVAVAYYLRRLSKLLDMPFSRIMRWKELGGVMMLSIVAGLLLLVLPMPDSRLAIKLSLQFVAYVIIFVALVLSTRTLTTDERYLLALPVRAARRLVTGA